MMSLIIECLGNCNELFLQDKPWRPSAVASLRRLISEKSFRMRVSVLLEGELKFFNKFSIFCFFDVKGFCSDSFGFVPLGKFFPILISSSIVMVCFFFKKLASFILIDLVLTL